MLWPVLSMDLASPARGQNWSGRLYRTECVRLTCFELRNARSPAVNACPGKTARLER